MKATKARTVVDGSVRASAIGRLLILCASVAFPLIKHSSLAAGDEWETKAPMPTARLGLAACAVNGKSYAIGGANVSEQRIASVEMYDPATDAWSPRANMPTARAMLATAVSKGKIYAIGGPLPGEGGIATVEEYDPASDTWTTRTSMPTRRWALTAETIGGEIYAMGGAMGTTVLSVVENYDPLDDVWNAGQDMTHLAPELRGGGSRTVPFGRWGLASARVGNTMYVMGGAYTGPPHPKSCSPVR
jgi:N-acetylneuraminic acid mutarotase